MNTPSQQPGFENGLTFGDQAPRRLSPEARARMMEELDRQLERDKEGSEIAEFVTENTPPSPRVSEIRRLSPEARARMMKDLDRQLEEDERRDREILEIAEFVAENTPPPPEVGEISASCRTQARDIVEDKRYH